MVVRTQAQALTLSIADSLYAIGDYTNAINKYAEVGTSRSDLQIARAYNAMGNFDKSIMQYNHIIARDSTLQIATFELGKLNLKLKKPKEALVLFSKLTIKGGGNPEYLYYQGEAYRNLEEYEKSVVSYKMAVAIDSTHLRSLFQLAKYYVVQKEDNVAMPYIDQALGFYENDLSFINLKALAHFHNGAFDKAIPWFERVLKLAIKRSMYMKNWHTAILKIGILKKQRKPIIFLFEMMILIITHILISDMYFGRISKKIAPNFILKNQ